MILLRQKTFTRGENEAFLELYKATEGFTKLPTRDKQPLRDVFRFLRAGNDIKEASIGFKFRSRNKKGWSIDRDNLKTLLNNSGLTKSASEVDHVIDKYTNKRALARLRRLQNKGYLLPSDNNIKTSNKHLKDSGKRIKSVWRDTHIELEGPTWVVDPDLRKRIEESGKTGRVEIKISDKKSRRGSSVNIKTKKTSDGVTIPKKGIIYPGINSGEGAILHEIGHIDTYIRDEGNRTGIDKHRLDTIGNNRYMFNVRKDKSDKQNKGDINLEHSSRVLRAVGDAIQAVANENSANINGKVRASKLNGSQEIMDDVDRMSTVNPSNYITRRITKNIIPRLLSKNNHLSKK